MSIRKNRKNLLIRTRGGKDHNSELIIYIYLNPQFLFSSFSHRNTLTLREREKKRQIPERKIRNFQFWEKEKEITKGNFHSNWNIFSFGFFFSNNKSEIKRSFLTFVLRLIFDQRKRNKSISLFNNHSFFFLFCCC